MTEAASDCLSPEPRQLSPVLPGAFLAPSNQKNAPASPFFPISFSRNHTIFSVPTPFNPDQNQTQNFLKPLDKTELPVYNLKTNFIFNLV